jgi:hypothetical protein
VVGLVATTTCAGKRETRLVAAHAATTTLRLPHRHNVSLTAADALINTGERDHLRGDAGSFSAPRSRRC